MRIYGRPRCVTSRGCVQGQSGVAYEDNEAGCCMTATIRKKDRGHSCPRRRGPRSPDTIRLTQVDIPNGMHTEYGYDGEGRQTTIHHKDGGTVKQGFDYEFATGGNITKITHEDDAYWAYAYDSRDRLTQAERYDDTPSLLHRYTYTYDDGGNMLTKAVYDAVGMTTDTTTFGYNNANEQTSMVNGATTVTQAYDAWGRLTSRDDGTYSASYAYRYGTRLYSVTSDFPGEGNVTYETGGDGKRRSRVAGANETWYNYTVGFDVVSTEDDADGSSGALTMTNVVRSPTAQVSATLADLAGTTPASGTARYYATDHLGSTRSAWDAAKASVGSYEFTPYGSEYSQTGAALDTLAGAYTGKPWDDSAQLFHFPFRQYSPDMARWTSRDPLGMVDGPNVYGYIHGQVVMHYDPLGHQMQSWYDIWNYRGWPLNSRVCNESSNCIVVWSSGIGFTRLDPGECTSGERDEGDFFYWGYRWYKVGVDTARPDENSPGDGYEPYNGPTPPPTPPDDLCGC